MNTKRNNNIYRRSTKNKDRSKLYVLVLFKLYVLVLINVLFYSATSCIDNEIHTDTYVPTGKIRIPLNTNLGDYAIPTTRATANEDEMEGNMWMLVFTGNEQENARFTEVVKAQVSRTGSYVTLTKTDQHCHIMIIGNCPAEYYNSVTNTKETADAQTLAATLKNKTYNQSKEMLWTTKLPHPAVSTVPYIGQNIPMTATVELPNGINNQTRITNATNGFLNLKRHIAKTDVTTTAPNFELIGATIINTPVNAPYFRETPTQAYPSQLTHFLATDATDPVSAIAPAAWDTQTQTYTTRHNPIYHYESATENNTAVIIRGTYNGNEYYYKLAYRNDAGQPIEIQHNKHYRFKVTTITGPGKNTLEEIIAEAPGNVNYHIIVVDDTSHDIISNGQYYLGLSNSELIVYAEGDQQDIIAFTVNTDATALSGNLPNIITAEGSGLTLTNPVNNGAVNLSTSPDSPGTTEVKIALSSSFESGTITVRLGDLVKQVQVTKRVPLSYSGSETIEGTYVSGVITRKGDGEDWLSLSADGVNPGNEVNLTTPGTIHIMASSNISANGGTNRTGGEFYLSRNNEDGRAKYLITQAYLDLGNIPLDPYGYVGAFWRSHQTGERLIRIPHINGAEGNWNASVLEGDEWIILDTQQSLDPHIGWKNGNNEQSVADMNDEGNDARYQVNGEATTVGGNLGQNGHIYFRIGLKDTHQPTANTPARYGVVLLSYNDNTKFSKIYIRQGEDGDYLMNPGDTDESGTTWGNPARPMAKKFSPYNATHPEMTNGGTDHHNHPHIQIKRGAFTHYPTQAGAYLQFANENHQRFAYHPVNPMGGINEWEDDYKADYWETLTWSFESCPGGWRRPGDGSMNTTVAPTNNIRESEMRQSLYLNPTDGTSINTDNAIYGYYADGFFDRRKVVASPHDTPSCAVSTNNKEIAYSGYLFFNPKDNRSLFFPLAGHRSSTNGSLQATGTYCAYWTGTTHSDPSQAWVLTLENGSVYQSAVRKSQAVSIRCVRE